MQNSKEFFIKFNGYYAIINKLITLLRRCDNSAERMSLIKHLKRSTRDLEKLEIQHETQKNEQTQK